ncbi:PilZ domain-containing protein [Synechococcus sp. BA-132 BA5]|uniref:PilZ domain-containing protein n=1 Tax=Synechococcus sp. BA-132 BA5 TaxID=3110252 RepID=UPI002B203011|nr:PilZ domain-containing protein [Synechococcus sp. BA-132 BA5]MEA5416803.1 PilZ domain-containing protein [Synechococcus sp. BA-132 BA5]
MERFREAFRRLEEPLQDASRSDRFKPPTGLATARLHQAAIGASEEVPGEVLDLSMDGLKMAIHASHAFAVGQNCSVVVGDGEGETYDLRGTVRWIEATSDISVMGHSLDSAHRIGA